MTESEKDILRSRRYTRAALVSAFLLAFFWPLGSFFFWIFLGATSYFIFLTQYYKPRLKRDKPDTPAWQKQNSQPLANATKKKVGIVLLVLGGIGFFILFFLMLIGFIVGSDDSNTETISENKSIELSDRTALESNPKDLDALTNIGNQFYSQDQFDSALFYYEKVLLIDPKNSSGMYNKALVFYQKHNYTKSIEWAKKCFSTYPENTAAIMLVGDSYYTQGSFNEAISWYRQAYDKGANNPELLNIMAYIYEKQNRPGEAIQFYKETLKQDSSFVEAYERLAELDPSKSDWYRKKAEQWKLR